MYNMSTHKGPDRRLRQIRKAESAGNWARPAIKLDQSQAQESAGIWISPRPAVHREQSTRNGKFPASPCLPFECYARLLRYIIVFCHLLEQICYRWKFETSSWRRWCKRHLIICVHHQTTLECYRVDCCIRRSRESIAKEAKVTHSLSIVVRTSLTS